MRKLIYLTSVIFFLVACEKEKEGIIPFESEDDYLVTPAIVAKRGDGEISLRISGAYHCFCRVEPSVPDTYEIYYSKTLGDWEFYEEIDGAQNEVKIGNLTNGTPYYFKVTGKKKHLESVSSPIVMSIPSEAEKTEEPYPNLNDIGQEFSISHDGQYILYERSNNLYYQTISGGGKFKVDEIIYGANWSPIDNRIVYISHFIENSTAFADNIVIYDINTQQRDTILEIDYENYYIQNAQFSPDGEEIFFYSSEENSEIHLYDLWAINLETRESRKLTDFESFGFEIYHYRSWTSSLETIYLDGKLGNIPSNIYSFNFESSTLTSIIESPWRDRHPVVSPDNTKIVFISDRTGGDELWAYDIEADNYQQVTGSSPYRLDARYTNIEWINKNEVLVTMFSDSESRLVALEVLDL